MKPAAPSKQWPRDEPPRRQRVRRRLLGEPVRHGGGASRPDPSPSLIAETAGLPLGQALDAGCGHGADAVWLASRGWQVTAVDVSPAAVEQAQRTAEDVAGPHVAARIAWIDADLTTWEPGVRFDLVTSHYVHVPGPPEELFARLASWVAPGGTLIVVPHGHTPGHARASSSGKSLTIHGAPR